MRRSRMLAEFKSLRYGEDDKFYPRDGAGRPWRRHGIAVSRAELTVAGYPEFSKTWRWMPDADPWCNVYWDGGIELWFWSDPTEGEYRTRLCRARFIERLADVLETRLQRATKAVPSDKD